MNLQAPPLKAAWPHGIGSPSPVSHQQAEAPRSLGVSREPGLLQGEAKALQWPLGETMGEGPFPA